jgi:hypothetical protein
MFMQAKEVNSKLEMMCFEMPDAPYPNRYAKLNTGD